MDISLLYWILWIFWALSLFARSWREQYPWAGYASDFIAFVLFFLLGWKVFGFVIHA